MLKKLRLAGTCLNCYSSYSSYMSWVRFVFDKWFETPFMPCYCYYCYLNPSDSTWHQLTSSWFYDILWYSTPLLPQRVGLPRCHAQGRHCCDSCNIEPTDGIPSGKTVSLSVARRMLPSSPGGTRWHRHKRVQSGALPCWGIFRNQGNRMFMKFPAYPSFLCHVLGEIS